MKITVPKASLADALSPFAKAPSMDGSLVMASENGTVRIAGATHDARLEMTVQDAVSDMGGAFRIDGGAFRSALDAIGDEPVTLQLRGSLCTMTGAGGASMTLAVSSAEHTPSMAVPPDAQTAKLPTGFCGFLLQAMQAASTDPTRMSLNGVRVARDGLVGTDGRQLLELPLPIAGLGDSLTMPRSPLYHALRKMRWLRLSAWSEKGDPYACIEGIGFKLVLKTVAVPFPNYRTVIPAKGCLDVEATFGEDSLEALRNYLRSVQKADCMEVTSMAARVEFNCMDRFVSMPAETTGPTTKSSVHCRPEYLLRALNMGCTGLAFSSRAHMPIVAKGGVGTYLWMPMAGDTPKAAAFASRPTENTKSNNTPKENPRMTPTVTTVPTVPAVYRPMATAPAKPSEQTRPAVPQQIDPMTDLSTAVNEMRLQLDSLQSHLLEIGRKLKEASTVQRAKERLYQETARKLERIRMAV